MDENIRLVVWLGDSRKQVRSFPPEVRKSIGVALYDAQKGDKAPTAKPLRGVGSGVFEVALRFDTDAYRAVYAVQAGRRIYVLHAFQKKSLRGIKTPRQDVELIAQRYRQALRMETEL
ncbi:MAG: type II toxin-antitoxin system RelE/ParE family toxin [Candidatus Binataceae bacterium]